MNIYFQKILLLVLTNFTLISCMPNNKIKHVTIGTGAVTGVYYPTGGAIARMLNKKSEDHNIRVSVESTAGSVYNINSVISGDLELGVAQSDRQYQAYYGLAEWKKKGPQKLLRSVFSIHPESITLVASEKSNINSIMDIKNKRVNLGNPGSGQLQNSKDILSAFDISESAVKAEYVKAIEAPTLLQDERIDAFFYTVGHPTGNIKEATSGRIKVRIIEIKGHELDNLIKKSPYYTKSIILRSMYPNSLNKTDIATVGVKATLVTSKNVSPDIIYHITKVVFENFKEFKKLHPAYQVITKESMLEGLSAPIHPGALKYYKEVGLDRFINPNQL